MKIHLFHKWNSWEDNDIMMSGISVIKGQSRRCLKCHKLKLRRL